MSRNRKQRRVWRVVYPNGVAVLEGKEYDTRALASGLAHAITDVPTRIQTRLVTDWEEDR